MNSPSPSNAPERTPTCQTATDYGNFLVSATFILLCLCSAMDQDWFEVSGWGLLAVSMVFLMVTKPVSAETWTNRKSLACLFVLVVGLGVLLLAPPHHKKLPVSAKPKPASSAGATR